MLCNVVCGSLNLGSGKNLTGSMKRALAGIQTKCSARLFCFLDLEARICKIQN